MKINFDDTELIRTFEGHSLKAYPDPATGGDPWTISWGLTGPTIVKGLTITAEESVDMFMDRIDEFCTQLDKLLPKTLSKNQYVAVLSLAWNIGMGNLSKSTLLKRIKEGKLSEAADEFLKWDKAGGKVMAGLTKRRKAEKALFLA